MTTRRPRHWLAAFAVLTVVVVAIPASLARRNVEPQATAQSPQRIISLIPAVTEMLFAMGAGPNVIAVSTYDRFPAEVAALPKVGALVDPDVEQILSLRPDLVIVYGTQDDLAVRLNRASIPLYAYQHAGLADISETMRAVGRRVGRAAQAEEAADAFDRGLEAIRERVANLPRPRTAVLFNREAGSLRGMLASGGVGFLHDILVTAGGDDVFGDIPRQSVQISAETLLTLAPDVIVEIRFESGWNPNLLERELGVWRTLSAVPAVRDNRVHIIADDRFVIPGPRVVAAAERLAQVLHPR
jgi:iron complex transport system substrate-binding protein